MRLKLVAILTIAALAVAAAVAVATASVGVTGKEFKFTLTTKTARHGKVTLKRGKYTYICTVPGHASAGMKGTFKAS